MIEKSANGIPFLAFEMLADLPGLTHGVTTRSGGVSTGPYASLNLGLHTGDAPRNVMHNHNALAGAFDLPLNRLYSTRQVHGTAIACVGQPHTSCRRMPTGWCFSGCDGLATDVPGTALVIRTADCVPVILYDPVLTVLCIVHAGWRGTCAGISSEAVALLVTQYGIDAGTVIAGIGPGIGACCFETGKDVADCFMRHRASHDVVQRKTGSWFVDLKEANRQQLVAAGLREDRIEVASECTACSSDIFFSHRREKGETGRFGLLAGLEP